ncbi:MAG: hypothetical protein ACKOFW_17455, partial [Planctomycetaceae bacterium]
MSSERFLGDLCLSFDLAHHFGTSADSVRTLGTGNCGAVIAFSIPRLPAMPHAATSSQSASGRFPGYQTEGFYDEMFLADGTP